MSIFNKKFSISEIKKDKNEEKYIYKIYIYPDTVDETRFDNIKKEIKDISISNTDTKASSNIKLKKRVKFKKELVEISKIESYKHFYMTKKNNKHTNCRCMLY